MDDVTLGPPVPNPDKILCLGLNYNDHVDEVEREAPEVPTVFAKFRNSLLGHRSDIMIPTTSAKVDYEGELAAVIGSRCKGVSHETALQYVAGYMPLNDVTARDLQSQTSQWTIGKSADTFAPCGPVLVFADQIVNPQALALTTRLNGNVVQSANTGDMIFSVAHALAYVSSVMTLEPGDIITTGTPSGVGFARTPPRLLEHGDSIQVESEELGTLTNSVVEPSAT